VSLSSTLEDNAAPETESPETHISGFPRSGPPRIGFVSLGCPKNLVDSEVMMGLLQRGGAQLTPRAEDADILVVNTCSFIDSAKQESVDTILEMVQHKAAHGGRAQKLIVAGCLVERYRDEIRRNIPEVDAVIGTGELEAILGAAGLPARPANSPFTILNSAQAAGLTQDGAQLDPVPMERLPSAVNQHSRPESNGTQLSATEAMAAGQGAAPSRPEGDAREAAGRFSRAAWDGATAALPSYLYSDETPRILTTPRASAYIKIAEGCDHPCSFCIIPQLRGKFRSRPVASIVAEARTLIAQGVREITLIGQDTTCYGEDLAAQDGNSRPELADLLEALAPLPGLKWLRFLYAYPNKITTRLLETIARHDNIAKYLDVPLQHASASVLRRMKRGGTAGRFLQIIDKARATIPGLVLRTSFIVGFPGETEQDFDELCEFVQKAQIDWLGVFSYSDEDGAGAFALTDKVPRRTIEARRRKLMRLQNKISTRAKRGWVGREVEVLVEGESEETELLWQGRSLDQAPEIDGKILINDFGPHEVLIPGTFYRAEITESHDYDVVARILD
jgi:ribosomal protein S12 methylthiotransferase